MTVDEIISVLSRTDYVHEAHGLDSVLVFDCPIVTIAELFKDYDVEITQTSYGAIIRLQSEQDGIMESEFANGLHLMNNTLTLTEYAFTLEGFAKWLSQYMGTDGSFYYRGRKLKVDYSHAELRPCDIEIINRLVADGVQFELHTDIYKNKLKVLVQDTESSSGVLDKGNHKHGNEYGTREIVVYRPLQRTGWFKRSLQKLGL